MLLDVIVVLYWKEDWIVKLKYVDWKEVKIRRSLWSLLFEEASMEAYYKENRVDNVSFQCISIIIVICEVK